MPGICASGLAAPALLLKRGSAGGGRAVHVHDEGVQLRAQVGVGFFPHGLPKVLLLPTGSSGKIVSKLKTLRRLVDLSFDAALMGFLKCLEAVIFAVCVFGSCSSSSQTLLQQSS